MKELSSQQLQKINGGDFVGSIKGVIKKHPWGAVAVTIFEEKDDIARGYNETKNQDFYNK
jgi:bacteriocin-like protein